MEKQKIKDILLLGGGPACISCSIQLTRSNLNPYIIAKNIGGLTENANLIENFLGFPNGICGSKYVDLMKKHISKFEIPILFDEVKNVRREGSIFRIQTVNKLFWTKNLIIGTGTIPNKLEIRGEEEAYNMQRLFYEVKNLKGRESKKRILIVGGGDAAYDYALNIVKKSKEVIIIQRSKESKSIPILQQRVEQYKKIQVIKECQPIEIELVRKKILLITKKRDNTNKFMSDYILTAIGRNPNIEFLSPELKQAYQNNTNIPNLYYIGDVNNRHYRQISIAIGDGIKIGMLLAEKLRGLRK